MKKLIYSLLMLCVLSGSSVVFADSPPNPTYETWTNKSDNVGKQGNPVRVVKLVRGASRDASSVSIASGDAVTYSLISDDGVTVVSLNNSADTAFAGIAVTAIQTADGASNIAQDDNGHRNWGWIIVHGPAIAKVKAGATNNHSAGDPFLTSRDGGAVATFEATLMSGDVGVHTSTHTARMLKSTSAVGGFFMDAADTNTTAEVMVIKE